LCVADAARLTFLLTRAFADSSGPPIKTESRQSPLRQVVPTGGTATKERTLLSSTVPVNRLEETPVTTLTNHHTNSAASGEARAVWLLIAFLVAWIAVIIAIQVVQIHQNGYGSGFGDGNHVPTSVVHQLDVPGGNQLTEQQLMKVTDR
jgi:hypothetical protein